jgi:Ethanolamine utilization protein EutJ (predicted chaperonin)
MAKNKKAVVETVEEVKEEQKEEVVDKKAVVEKSSEYPKKYINTNQTELMF